MSGCETSKISISIPKSERLVSRPRSPQSQAVPDGQGGRGILWSIGQFLRTSCVSVFSTLGSIHSLDFDKECEGRPHPRDRNSDIRQAKAARLAPWEEERPGTHFRRASRLLRLRLALPLPPPPSNCKEWRQRRPRPATTGRQIGNAHETIRQPRTTAASPASPRPRWPYTPERCSPCATLASPASSIAKAGSPRPAGAAPADRASSDTIAASEWLRS